MGFFFTLGLHYGKKIGTPVEHSQAVEDGEKLEENPESLPARETLEAGSQHEKTVSADSIKEATKEEVHENNVKIDQPKAVELPSEKAAPAKHEEAHGDGETVAKSEHSTETHTEAAEKSFAVQLGSYTSRKEAQGKVKAFAKKGVNADIVTAVVNRQTRFRVVISGFKSKAAAEQRGKDLKSKHKIDSYIVIK